MQKVGVAKKYYFIERVDSGSVFVFVKKFDDKKAAEDYAAYETLVAGSERAVFFIREGFAYTEEIKEKVVKKAETKKEQEEVKDGKGTSKKTTITRKATSASV